MAAEAPRDTLFVPDFCGVRAVFVVVVTAQLLAFAVTLVNVNALYRGLEDLAVNSLLIQWIALSTAALLCVGRGLLRRLSEPVAAGLAYAGIVAVALLVSELAWWVAGYAGDRAMLIEVPHGLYLGRNLAITAIVAAIALRYFYVQHHWQQRVRSESEARVQALQARIRPHFFFNCMNTIASLTRTRPGAAEQAVEDLADLFRASMNDARTLVRLDDELALCRKYLSIEALRLGDRLKTQWAIDDLPGDARLPALILQPLLENAVYHGIEPIPGGGLIRIAGVVLDGALQITIANPKVAESLRSEGNRIAQENVRQRLAAHYGEAAVLSIEQQSDTYTVSVTIPC